MVAKLGLVGVVLSTVIAGAFGIATAMLTGSGQEPPEPSPPISSNPQAAPPQNSPSTTQNRSSAPPAQNPSPGPTGGCGRPVLSLPEHSRVSFSIKVSPGCPPPIGFQRWIVVQLHDQGSPPHSEYYLKWQITATTDYEITSTSVKSCSLKRSYLVIEVTDAEYEMLRSSSDGGDQKVLNLKGAPIVSGPYSNSC